MKLLYRAQINAWDQCTIESNNISSFELMEKASKVFSNWFQTLYFNKSAPIYILTGSGNNGGDGFCVAKLLMKSDYNVIIHHFSFSKNISSDNHRSQQNIDSIIVHSTFVPFDIPENAIIIDALLGTGIQGPVKGEYKETIQWMNQLKNTVVSIDIPSGMDPEKKTEGVFIKANHVLSFEIPKISFFFEDHISHLINWDYRSIGLSKSFVHDLKSNHFMIDHSMIKLISKARLRNESKKDFGFGQFCGGSPGMFGSVILASRSAMRSGLGRLAVTTPEKYHNNLFVSIPEAMAQADVADNIGELRKFKLVNKKIDAVAIGPGLGMSKHSNNFLSEFLDTNCISSILDADALNIISRNNWHHRITKNSIISPHKEEFERLFGTCQSHDERIRKQVEKSKELSIFIILKGTYTTITNPEGDCYYNRTGNVGMGTAGSGDVLTGMLLSFLSQGYSPLETCIMGVYIHGASGDSAATKYGEVGMIASDIIEYIPTILKNINGK